MTFVLCNILRFVLWPGIWSVWVKVLYVERMVTLMFLGCMFYKCQCWLMMLPSSFVIIASFASVGSVDAKRGVSESPAKIVDLSISFFNSVSFCFILKLHCEDQSHLGLLCLVGKLFLLLLCDTLSYL